MMRAHLLYREKERGVEVMSWELGGRNGKDGSEVKSLNKTYKSHTKTHTNTRRADK